MGQGRIPRGTEGIPAPSADEWSQPMLLSLPDVPLRSTSFGLGDRWLIWARMRMYPNRLVLVGWSLAGRHRRAIPLDHVAETDYADGRLLLDLRDGERMALRVEEPVRWARLIRAQGNLYDSRS